MSTQTAEREATKLLRELVESSRDEWGAPLSVEGDRRWHSAMDAARDFLSRAPAVALPREPTAQSDAPAPLPADAPPYIADKFAHLKFGPNTAPLGLTIGAPARDALVEDGRALFEKTLMGHLAEGRKPGDLDYPADFWLDRLDDGRYEYSRVDDAWLGWRLAAAALARKQSK